MKTRLAAFPLAFAALLAVASPSFAADAVPPDATEQLVSPAETFRDRRTEPAPPSAEAPAISLEEEKETPIEEEGPSFLIRTIYFEGNTIVPESEFEPYVEPFENRPTTFRRLKEFTQIVTDQYRALGYVTSRAYLPPQTVQDDAVTVKVIEGKIGKIHVEGNKHYKDSVYRDAIHLRPDRVFRYQDLESSLYFLNQQPDRKAKAFLIAGADPATSDIILKAEDTSPFHASYEFNNRGTNLTHHSRHVTTLTDDNFTGNADILSVSTSAAPEGAFDAVSSSYVRPVETTGTTYGIDASYAETAIVKHLKSLELEAESWTLTPSVTQNLRRDPAFSADVSAALEIKDSKTTADDLKVAYDRMRVLRVGPRFTWQDAVSRTTFSADAHAGLPGVLGGSSADDVNLSREGSSGEFVYYTASLARIQRMAFQSFLVFRLNGQYAFDTLTSLEEFRAGGAYSVRGYPESDSSGDYGYNASAEVNLPFFIAPKDAKVPHTKKRWREAVRLVGFLDAAKTYDKKRLSEGDVKDRFLLGTGLGVRVNLDRTFSLQCDVGWPIGDDSTEKNRRQTHLSVRGGF